ncbi:MAG: hypothetical protein KDK36_03535, partial [Leptospiraceae bacterium]|nr:hypothetical protein [Leptospiraceae bacterium]
KYKIKHKFFIGFLPMLIGPFLKDASYSLEHTKGYESKTVMKVSFDQFASDLKKDVSKNEFYLSRFKVSNSSTYYLRDNLINKDNTLKKEFISSNTIRRGN